jgi:hypothetical protein
MLKKKEIEDLAAAVRAQPQFDNFVIDDELPAPGEKSEWDKLLDIVDQIADARAMTARVLLRDVMDSENRGRHVTRLPSALVKKIAVEVAKLPDKPAKTEALVGDDNG